MRYPNGTIWSFGDIESRHIPLAGLSRISPTDILDNRHNWQSLNINQTGLTYHFGAHIGSQLVISCHALKHVNLYDLFSGKQLVNMPSRIRTALPSIIPETVSSSPCVYLSKVHV
jgi:hypothetical protein